MTQDDTLVEGPSALDPADGHVDGNAVAGALAAVFEAVLLRYVATPGSVRLDLGGIAELELAPVGPASR